MNKFEYFSKLAQYSQALLDRLPVELEPKPLSYCLGILQPEVNRIKLQEVAAVSVIREGETKIATYGNNNNWQGLNTIGMLMDRFTILLIREWSLRHKANKNPAKAQEVYEKQTVDIMNAMAHAAPGSSALNSKITHIKGGANAHNWDEAFYGLLTTNLILWESQEVLYVKDISILPSEELRDYISWFSRGNIVRNEYIQLCEELFWKI